MLSRRWILKTIVGGSLVGWLGQAAAQSVKPKTGDASLKETLLFGLKPRTPREQEFIDTVVAKVNSGALPVETVISTFRWARDKKPYGFPYFERLMRARATKLGVTL